MPSGIIQLLSIILQYIWRRVVDYVRINNSPSIIFPALDLLKIFHWTCDKMTSKLIQCASEYGYVFNPFMPEDILDSIVWTYGTFGSNFGINYE